MSAYIIQISLTSYNYIVGEGSLVSLGVLLGSISWFITDGMYLSFCIFYVMPRASYMYIQCVFIPSVVWRFFSIFSSSFGSSWATFSTSELHLPQLLFLGPFWDTVNMSVFLPSDKLLKI